MFCLLGQQGARIGPWLLPREGTAWLWLGLAAAAVLAPAGRPPPTRLTAWTALVLAVLAWPILSWRGRAALPPVALTAAVRPLSQPEARADQVFLSDFGRLRRSPPWRRLIGRDQDFVQEIEAWVWAPRTAAYRFELEADDGASLAVDATSALRHGSRDAVEVPLGRGLHALTLRHEQGLGAAHLALDWDRPPFLELIPLQGYLAGRPEALAPSALRRRHVATLASLLLAWTWWLAAFLVLCRVSESRHYWPMLAEWEARGRGFVGARWAKAEVRLAVMAFAAAGVFLFALEAGFRPLARDGLYFQAYTSEYLMQTVSVADLRDEPWRSLFYLHIQPPAFDALRAVLAHLQPPTRDLALLRRVDAGLYLVWGVVYAALIGLVCRWLAALTSRTFAVVGAALLALHPAVLFYATFLDSTLPSAALFCWFSFELWRWGGRHASGRRLAVSAIALFFTRSVFQWPFLLVLAASLALMRARWGPAARVLGSVALVMALYVAKQYCLFGVTMTSTFAADSFCKGLQIHCHGTERVPLPELPPASRARVLSRTAKVDGEYNYNQIAFLERSFAQMAEYRRHLRQRPWPTTLSIWAQNLEVYLRPSSRYTEHVIVDRLPWRPLYDRLFSGWPLVLGVGAGALAALRQGGRARRLALALPAAYVLVVTVIFESGENMRYKFFVEPALFVFLATQAYRLRGGGRSSSPRRDRTLDVAHLPENNGGLVENAP